MKIRVFLAIEIPPDLRNEIIKTLSPLKGPLPSLKWVSPENLHLTLAFLGDLERGKLDALAKNLSETLKNIQSFEMEIKGFGVFPNPEKPRIFWIGAGPFARLTEVFKAVSEALKILDISFDEKKAFSPHITIARAKDFVRLDKKQISEFADLCYGKSSCNSISVIKSSLMPKGSDYETLYKINLGGS